MRRPVPKLLLVTDPELPGGLLAPVEAALGDGVPAIVAVQLRAKALSARELVAAGHALREVCSARGASLIVNGRIDVALACSADGVHLPERGMEAADARALLGAHALVGRSCHDAHGLARARSEAADYATLGPVGNVPGKNPPLGLVGFEPLARSAGVPVLALGGVGIDDVPALLAHGAHGVAVVRAVLGSSDPRAGVSRILSTLGVRG